MSQPAIMSVSVELRYSPVTSVSGSSSRMLFVRLHWAAFDAA